MRSVAARIACCLVDLVWRWSGVVAGRPRGRAAAFSNPMVSASNVAGRAVVSVRLPEQHRPIQPGEFGIFTVGQADDRAQRRLLVAVAERHRTRGRCGCRGYPGVEGGRAHRHRTGAVSDIHRRRVLGASRSVIESARASTCQGCALPADGARIAAAAMMSTTSVDSCACAGSQREMRAPLDGRAVGSSS